VFYSMSGFSLPVCYEVRPITVCWSSPPSTKGRIGSALGTAS